VTDIAMREQQTALATYSDNAMDRLGRWLQQADAVFAVAERVCSTSFAPAAYRGKPDEAAAAMLAGAELGFDPMASLRAFDNIQGIPAPKAITLRAVVLGKGHEVRIVQSTAQCAEVTGRRRGDTEWQTSYWDIPRASTMPQYKSNPNWKTNPAAMLVARATAEVCRWIAADAIMGMPYAAEEIADEPSMVAAPVARRLAAADLDAPPAIEAAPPAEPRSEAQKRRMFQLWADLGYGTPDKREARLARTAMLVGVERIESSDELTAEQAGIVIAKLEARKAEIEAQAAGGEA
jgi:hypothetical protein